ncbi:MAG: TRAP transporter fused permease subunit [Pseudolabrys sp.]
MKRSRLADLSAFLLAALCVFWALDPQTLFGFAIYREQFLSVVLGLTLSTCYLSVTVRRRATQQLAWYDGVAAFVGLAVAIWMSWHWEHLLTAVGDQTNEVLILGVIVVCLVMEGLRRVTGLPLFIVVIVFIAYALVGDKVPGELKALPVSVRQLMTYLAFDPTSVFGTPFTIGAQVVVIFIFLGQLLLKTHGGQFFTDLAMATMGRQRGGAAKVAVAASALFGSISGSATSNVASTGVLTIPLMRSTGYSAAEAGAIEAVASTGGQFMPPIMGAAAFLMAEFLEIAYAKVVVAAIVPALLYYLAVFIQVDLLAARRGINVVDQSIPRARNVLKDGWHFIVPFALLLYVLFELLRSAQEAAVWAAGAIIVLGMIFSYKGARLRPWQIVEAFIETGRISVELLLILGAAGFVIGVLNITGLGFALTFFLIHLGGSSEILLLIIAAIACIILGMGMPTSGVYVLLAALIAPALVQVGVPQLAAHMFILYFGMMSMITPPIALAAFAAAALAKTDAMTIGFTAMRLGWVAYIIPFLFVFAPSLLLIGSNYAVVLNIGTAVIGVYVISVASIGYFTRLITLPWRIALMAGGAAALLPTVLTPGGAFIEICGSVLSILFLVYEWWAARRFHIAGISAE